MNFHNKKNLPDERVDLGTACIIRSGHATDRDTAPDEVVLWAK